MITAGIVAVAMGTCVLSTSAATAPDTRKIVPATIVFKNGSRPDRPGNCSALVLAQWKHVAEETSVTIRYKRSGKDASITGRPPFNDHVKWVIHYDAPAGYHWILISKASGDGPGPSDCSPTVAKFRDIYDVTATAELSLCAPAKRKTQSRSQLPQCGPSECSTAVSELVKTNTSITAQWSKLVASSAMDKVGALANDMQELQARAALAGTLCRPSAPACPKASAALRDSVSKQVSTLSNMGTTGALIGSKLINDLAGQRNALIQKIAQQCK